MRSRRWYFGATYFQSNAGRWMSPDWAAKAEPIPYAKMGYPQTLNLYAYVENNPLSMADADGHCGTGSAIPCGEEQDRIADSENAQEEARNRQTAANAEAQKQQVKPPSAQQPYGRQPDGSYKADPADVQAAIKAGKPIFEKGNPDHKSECVFACKALSQMNNIGTSQWRKGKAAVGLNDTTDIGTAIATLGSGRYPLQHGNSGIYMGHDENGNIKIVDQWPKNGSQMDHPNEHLLLGSGLALNPNAYFVIKVPKP